MLSLLYLKRLVVLLMLLRVGTDVAKPLMRGKMVHFEDVGEGWVFYKYERLPIFCYRCGILGLQDRKCKKIIKVVYLWMTINFNLVPSFVL